MAEVDVKKSSKQSSTDTEGSRASEGSLQRQERGTDVSRSRRWDPFGFSVTPADCFSANPFSLMRRMSEEMDRTFGSFFAQSGRVALLGSLRSR